MTKFRPPGAYLLLAASIVLLISGGALLYRSLQQSVVIVTESDTITLHGRFDSVGQAVEAAGIELRSEDSVQPPLESPVPASGSVSIVAATPIELSVDGEVKTHWTHQENLASFLAEQGVRLTRSSKIRVDDKDVPWPATASTLASLPIDQRVELVSQVDIQIEDGRISTPWQTSAATVGEALMEAGIDIFAVDMVEPSLSSPVSPGQDIVVGRATPVTVDVDGHQMVARTSQQDVVGVLAELGLGMVGRDRVSPGLDDQFSADDQILVSRSSVAYEVVETPIPFSSQLQPSDALEIDQRTLASAGSPGTFSQLRRLETVGTTPISPTVVGEWISRPPVDEVIQYGTNIVVRTLDTPEGPQSYWRVVRMRATAYTAADAGKSPSHPAYGITASGRPAGYGVVAIDPDVVPFRSQVYVPGYGVGYAGDTGGGVQGRWIDLGYDEGEIETWNGYVDVYYLTPVPDADSINYLIPLGLP